ncbi:DNA phosphorothioation system sulfurtransferase DndC [Streptomyces kaniharaensis]|uniref:DNA phosphorothioation system sulfurtransferase DndC n=1 Tax=Streptomyces kaniharaensis TaxID=212423 RepID=A0A6N7KT85_9ACTN|nr:DNA phosphorothioation system sulfurtransferase DndC [Streptomyces kaniharaensis]MQS14740.1 DNA phosphorothioation system sulfurtransferase DndC [Streptomyces kaniharaensis]
MSTPTRRAAPFEGSSLDAVVAELTEEVRELYTADEVPWVIGYSGGKDSTAILQLVWLALKELPVEQRKKTVYVISTDTLVENPIVASWVSQSLETMRLAAEEQALPIEPNRLTPATKDTFWVNLIGRGYPAPRPKFRWCTERMKIKPSNSFIRRIVRQHGEAIMVLGIRKQESQARARAMAKHEKRRVRDRLSPNGNLPNSLVYSPIEDWSNDEVWTFLMQQANPWGYSNKDLLTMYQGASADSECPLVVDSSTPSCGDSRFGCWTCTLVEQDKSMAAMIQNDEEKEWMRPLLDLRNKLDVSDDSHLRDFRKMKGNIQLFGDRIVHGPYTQQSRETWLRDLLEAQTWVRANGPEEVRSLELITMAELHEIRQLWVFEKHEVEDSLPRIYKEKTGEDFPGRPLDEHLTLGADEIDLLREACEGDELLFSTARELLAVERRFRTMTRRSGLFEELEKSVKRGFFQDKEDAHAWALKKKQLREEIAEYLPLIEDSKDEENADAPA